MGQIRFGAVALGALAALFFMAAAGPARAAIKTEPVDYTIGNDAFEGYLAYDDALTGKRPGVVIYSAWTGIGDNERKHAQMLAKLGYVAFVADIYGKGVHPKPPKEAAAESGKFAKDRALYRERAEAGLDQLLKNPMVDAGRVAAIGYCFGGMGALELGRSGANIKAIVTYHGLLGTPTPQDAKNIKAHVLILNGADDPNAPPPVIAGFEKEMEGAHIDWQLVSYGGAVHCFTDSAAGSDTSHGCAYNPEADKRSWQATEDFFHETLSN